MIRAYIKAFLKPVTRAVLPGNAILSIIPEIEGVTIGVQHWATSNLEMVATPMGNPINEMQLGTATEKITNGGFDDATGWTLTSNFTVADGVLKAINAGVTDTATHGTALLSGTWYKVVYTVLNYSSGGVTVSVGGANGTQRTANGTCTQYIKTTSTSATKFTSGATTSLQIDNVSVKQLGWADSTELYNGLIAQGYTAEDALKEVAWWCHYNNDPVSGATYGKLYNWYAAKLLQTDIDTYNAENPTTPWGWKVPTDAELETLRTTVASLGWNYDGSTDLGSDTSNKQGKALASDSLWNASSVEGAVGNTDYPDKRNISGFTGLPGGYRLTNGNSSSIGSYGFWWSSTESSTTNARARYLGYNLTSIYRINSLKNTGISVRLLKS